jgi:hypothetical protein
MPHPNAANLSLAFSDTVLNLSIEVVLYGTIHVPEAMPRFRTLATIATRAQNPLPSYVQSRRSTLS